MQKRRSQKFEDNPCMISFIPFIQNKTDNPIVMLFKYRHIYQDIHSLLTDNIADVVKQATHNTMSIDTIDLSLYPQYFEEGVKYYTLLIQHPQQFKHNYLRNTSQIEDPITNNLQYFYVSDIKSCVRAGDYLCSDVYGESYQISDKVANVILKLNQLVYSWNTPTANYIESTNTINKYSPTTTYMFIT